MMFDTSRNAVLRPDTLRSFLRKMALMGMNLGMMYTEDTYEVPGQPYFGYQRGAYSRDELMQMDKYAAMFGIELVPCIQTLAHLECVLRWQEYADVRDIDNILLVDEPMNSFVTCFVKWPKTYTVGALTSAWTKHICLAWENIWNSMVTRTGCRLCCAIIVV